MKSREEIVEGVEEAARDLVWRKSEAEEYRLAIEKAYNEGRVDCYVRALEAELDTLTIGIRRAESAVAELARELAEKGKGL